MISEDASHWKGILYFDLKVYNIYFNKKGKYLIKLSISSSRGDLNKVKLYIDDFKKSIYEHEYTSEPCYQEDTDIPCQLSDTQFRFEMPEEFSEGEVHLLFETYQFPESPLVDPFKCGEGMFLIFPRAAPMQSEPSTSTEKEKYYHFTTQLPINHLLEQEGVYVNIGQVHIAVLLELREKKGRTHPRDSIKLHNAPIVYPLSKMVIPEEEECENDFSESQVSKLSCTDNSCERTSHSPNTGYSENSSVYNYPESCRQGKQLPVKDSVSSHTSFSEENTSDSILATQSPSKLTSADLDTQACATQKHRKDTLFGSSNESSFKKAWTTGVDQPMMHGSKGSLSKWSNHQVDSTVAARKAEESAVYDLGKRSAGSYRKLLKQPDMVRNMSVSSKGMMIDPPLSSTSQGPPNSHLCGSFLDDAGNFEVVVQVHSACDLPSNSLGRPPQPYVIGKTTNEQGSGLLQSATHATSHATCSPLWEELLVMKVPKENFQAQELILSILDHPSKTVITKFKLPLRPFNPFYHYHLELEQVVGDVKVKLYITLLIKTDEINSPSLLSEIFGMEVVLRDFSSRLSDSCTEPLVAVVRIVSNFTQYHQTYLEGKPKQACIKTRKVKCPSSELASDLASIGKEEEYSIAQITFSGEPSQQPKWNQMLFFHGDEQSLFSHSSALVIEFFKASQVVSFGRWQPTSPIGYSFCNLDQSLLVALRRDNASMGLRIGNITIKDSPLKNHVGEAVAVNIILRLITEKRPDHMISPSHYAILPLIDMATAKSEAFPANLPQDDPKIFNEPVTEVSSPKPLSTVCQRRPHLSTNQQSTTADLDASAFAIMERQTQEIEKHRYAMKKMADDIIQLKSEATRLQAANNRLRLELQHRNENNYLSSLPSHFENTTHAELVQRIVIVKGSLDEQIAINRELKLEIQSLQNQLIKKNEKEKEYYKLQDAHKNQQVLLQKMQERLRRTKTLEETCKKQEKVIMRLEEFLANSKTTTKDKKGEEDQTETVHDAVSEENRRLRAQLLNYERTSKAADDMDRLHIHDKLQRAEGRVAALEKELLENTRRWARDKAELQLKLSERQMSQNSGHWQYPSLAQEPSGLFDLTPPDSRSLHSHPRRGSPKLSPLSKK